MQFIATEYLIRQNIEVVTNRLAQALLEGGAGQVEEDQAARRVVLAVEVEDQAVQAAVRAVAWMQRRLVQAAGALDQGEGLEEEAHHDLLGIRSKVASFSLHVVGLVGVA